MSLDIDLVATVDLDSRPCDGIFVSPLGVRVELYKNWLYVGDRSAWRDGGFFIQDTVMQIQRGSLCYLDVMIEAERLEGPDGDTIVFAAWSSSDKNVRGIVGAGTYAYQTLENGREVYHGITPEHVQRLREFLDRSTIDEIETTAEHAQEAAKGGDPEYVGHRVEGDRGWVSYRSYELDDPIRAVDLSRATRRNPGDRYIADHLGIEVPATAPGEAEVPLLNKLL